MNLQIKKRGQKTQKKRRITQIIREKSATKSQIKQKKEKIILMRISDQQQGISIPFSLWSDSVKKVIKQKGGYWCPIFKIWKLSRVKSQFLLKQLNNLFPESIQTPPYFIDRISLNDKKINNYQIINHKLYQKLYPFQRDTLNFCLQKQGKILIADEMGVGKSIQSLACSLMYLQNFPLLIICPSALKYVWKDEVLKWMKGIIQNNEITIIKKGNILQKQLQNSKIIITSYEIATKIINNLQKIQIVICDQAHYLKNPNTNRCQLLIPFLSKKKRIFMLTGTPALAKPRQLFNILKILKPNIFKSFQQFGNRYCQRRQNPWNFKWQFQGAKNLAQLHYILKKTIMIRRLKQDILPQLPSKQRQIIYIQTQKQLINEIKNILDNSISFDNIRNSNKIIDMFKQQNNNNNNNSIMKCYLLSGLSKLQSIKEYIHSILQNDIKIIVFAHHQIIMDQLEHYFQSLKYQYIRLDGSSTPQNRKKKVDHFQNQFNIKIALLSITAMGTGFTLTAASTVLFAELHWTPAMLIQAEDRTHRIGQKNSVNIHYLIGDKTLDPLMLRQLQRKIETVGKVLDAASDSLNLQIVEKGDLGKFQIVRYEQTHQKGSKITDYFAPSKKKEQDKDKEIEIQIIQDAQSQILTKQKIDNISQSEDSFMIQFIRRKKEEMKTQKQKYK